MEIPIFSQPQILSELTGEYRDAFHDIGLFKHFQELVFAFHAILDQSTKKLAETKLYIY